MMSVKHFSRVYIVIGSYDGDGGRDDDNNNVITWCK